MCAMAWKMQELFVCLFFFQSCFFLVSCGKNKAFLNLAHSLLASSPSLHELFCMSFSGFVYHPQKTQKKMQTYEAKFSLLWSDGAWRRDFTSWSMEGFSSVWAGTGCVFSCFWVLVFATSFSRSSSSSSRFWGLSFWEEEDEDQVAGRSHMQNQSFHMYKKTKNPHPPPKEKKKKKGITENSWRICEVARLSTSIL